MIPADALQSFVGHLLPMLPEDFAGAVAALDLTLLNLTPGRLPVCRFWKQAMAGDLPLLAPLAALEPSLRWVQNPNYVAAPPDPAFLENYGYAVLAGPGGLIETRAVALGLLLLGPGTHYPTHRHPAVEIYVVASGESEWHMGEGSWRRRPAGDVIRHESMVPHATRALTDPLLAVYVWRGDLDTHARITGAFSADPPTQLHCFGGPTPDPPKP
jgi:quercetin dioxygenase-like cupin family protein